MPDGVPWAADNGRFNRPDLYSDESYLRWLTTRPGKDRCLFATAPDVVGDPVATLALSRPMFEPIRAAGFRVALVAQDGLTPNDVPWDEIDALFLGGSTEWKLSEAAHSLGHQAKARGKWLHMGRVNSGGRVRLAHAMGCDSVDGTYVKYGPEINTPKMLGWMEDLDRRPILGLPIGPD